MSTSIERRQRFEQASRTAVAAGAPLLVGIDTSALRQNLSRIRRRLSGRRLCAVFKADAYGHGISHVAPIVAEYTNFFAVVDNAEARCVLEHAPRAEILRLRPGGREEVSAALRVGLPIREPTATIEHARMLGWEARRHAQQLRIDIPIDVSGLGREGFSVADPEQLRSFLLTVANMEALSVASLSCHLVPRGGISVAQQKAILLEELARFLAIAETFSADCERCGHDSPQLSAFSTAASCIPELNQLIRQSDFQFFDRIGNDLFGSVSSSDFRDSGGTQVMTAASFVSAIFHRQYGETVGYERLYSVASPQGETVAVAPVGWSTYGREYQGIGKARNPGFVASWEGEVYELVGRQSMNMTTIRSQCGRARLLPDQQILLLANADLVPDTGSAPTVAVVAGRMGGVQHEFVTAAFGLARSAARFAF